MFHPQQDNGTPPRTAYSAAGGLQPETERLQSHEQVDVLVVGGGFVGISAALHAAIDGAKVAVLEMNEIGWGSAARNAGQVSAHATKLEPWDVIRIYGNERGARLNEAGANAPRTVLDFASRYGFDISEVRGGIVSAAHSPQALQKFQKRAEYWQRQEAPVELLDRRQLAEVLGTNQYVGGIIDRRGIAINPLALIRGLARAAVAQGVKLYEHAKVTALGRQDQRWCVETALGAVVAEHVLLCTNAYTDDLWPGLRRTIIPVRGYQIWTKPLDPQVAARILPGISAFNDSQRVVRGARKHPDGRLQFSGGRPSFGRERAPAIDKDLRRVERMFGIRGLQAEGWWSGWVTRGIDDGWRIHNLAPGLTTAIACNGRGIAMGPIMGRELARYVAGSAERDLIVPVSQPKQIPGHAFHRPFAELAVLVYGWRDAREMRHAGNDDQGQSVVA